MKEYEIEVPYDSDSMKNLKCPRCGNDIISDEATFCKICGLPLYNRCGEWHIFGNEFDSSCGHINPPDARFCEICGNRTSYFAEYHILKSWEEIKGVPKNRTGYTLDDNAVEFSVPF